jgi:pyruvate/2-oxoglutarate dehydrogenase complex dihydrolipoamide dehydrogenase (E3) component
MKHAIRTIAGKVRYRRCQRHEAEDRKEKTKTRGFMKTLIDSGSERILGFCVFGVEAGEIMASVQVAMIAGLPFTALRDTIFTHPTMLEGLISLFENVPPKVKR